MLFRDFDSLLALSFCLEQFFFLSCTVVEGISQVVNGSTPGNDRNPIAIVVPGLTSDSTAAVILFYFSSLHSSFLNGLLLLT